MRQGAERVATGVRTGLPEISRPVRSTTPSSQGGNVLRAGAVVVPPDRRLGAVGDVDLAHEALEMDIDGRLGDVEMVGNGLVAVTIQQAADDLPLAQGQSTP